MIQQSASKELSATFQLTAEILPSYVLCVYPCSVYHIPLFYPHSCNDVVLVTMPGDLQHLWRVIEKNQDKRGYSHVPGHSSADEYHHEDLKDVLSAAAFGPLALM